MNTTPRYDVMQGRNYPERVLQWVTRAELDAYCESTGRTILAERQIGNVLREVTVSALGARPAARGGA